MKVRLALLIALLALPMTFLYAGPVPITSAQLGANVGPANAVTFGPAGQPEYLICPTDVADGCGGAFTESIGGINATIWCVDSQLQINWNNTYSAYIEDMNGTPGPFDKYHVHYEGVTTFTGGAGGWSYDLSGYGVANPNTALTRYELAALLITQYVPSDNMPADSAQNRAIQDAIWRLTENGVTPSLSDAIGGAGTGVPAGYGDWIAYAASRLSTTPSSFFSQWAVVSGGWDSTNFFAGHTAYQTFLVQVTPEPRFYGLLLVVLLSVFGISYRRRMA